MIRFIYTDEMNRFILDHREGRTLAEAADLFNERFGTRVTVSAMRSKYKNMHIRVGVRRQTFSDVWPREVAACLEEVNAGRTSSEVAEILNGRFGGSWTADQVRAYRKNHRLPCGVDRRFRKGHTPWTKGRSIEEICKTPEALARVRGSQYKPGSKPWNHMPVGSEVFKYGYWWVKTGEPNHWREKHRLIYEETHGVKLGRDDVVTFLDGDTGNMDPGNLELVTKAENATLTGWGMRSEDPEITRTGVAIARLRSAIRGREDEG